MFNGFCTPDWFFWPRCSPATSQKQAVVPHLQTVFQVDEAHMNFGKYLLYQCYGITADCNAFPVALGIIFGNEDKDGWDQFCNFAHNIILV